MSDRLHLLWKSRRRHTRNEPGANGTSACSVLRALIGSALRTGCFRFGLLHDWNAGRHVTFVFPESVPEVRQIKNAARCRESRLCFLNLLSKPLLRLTRSSLPRCKWSEVAV
jgi:hypothetical protein